MQKEITIYTDGACSGNPGKGGWAAVLIYKNNRKEIYGGYRLTTNNRMELTAAIEALKAIKAKEKCRINIYTDSQLLTKAFNQGWISKWIRTNWKRGRNAPVLNSDLWKQLAELSNQHEVTFNWVEGHAGHPENELCDKYAREATHNDELPIDTGYESADGSKIL
jgi:ribonuclease HI